MATVDTSILSSEILEKYKVVNNSFRQIVKNDPRDQLVLEVGDVKQPSTFFPQIKICRWGSTENDNEVNASFRIIDSEFGEATQRLEAERIIWNKGNLECHFYDIAPNEHHSEGGYEFEVILKNKPKTNVLEFSLQTKGLEFFYQPPLTQEEVDQGCIRPDNVVGSYAVYYKDCPANIKGGKLYRTGKAFHIYRPRIEDANGDWVWGELNVDEVNGKLTVTIPQSFLDSASYPVVVDPTFGYAAEGATGEYGNANTAMGSLFTSPSDMGTVTSISIWSGKFAPAVNLKALIWLHSNSSVVSNSVIEGLCGTPLDPTVEQTYTYGTAPSLSASTDYVLGLVSNDNTVAYYYDAGDANQGHNDIGNNYANPTTFSGFLAHSTNKFSVYITYTAGGGTTSVKTVQGLAKASVKTVNGLAIASVKTINGLA